METVFTEKYKKKPCAIRCLKLFTLNIQAQKNIATYISNNLIINKNKRRYLFWSFSSKVYHDNKKKRKIHIDDEKVA